MMYPDEYAHFRKEQQQRKTMPYRMSNEELAQEYYKAFKEEYPTATLHTYGITQYICQDKRARKNLVKMLKEQQAQQEDALQRTKNLIYEIEGADA